MKTQAYGWTHACTIVLGGAMSGPPIDGVHAVENYRERRQNGLDEDSPSRPFPEDGKKSDWIICPDKESLPTPRPKGLFSKGGFKEGWQGEGCYRIRYEEGPGDRAWMEERDRNYLARMEREKVHAKISALLEEATKLSHGGQYREAIELCDLGLAEDCNHLGLRQQRASYHEALFQQTKSLEHKQLYLEKAIEDYRHCVIVDEHDETSRLKVEEIQALLTQLADAKASAASSPPALDPEPGPSCCDSSSRSGAGEGAGSAPGLSYRGATTG